MEIIKVIIISLVLIFSGCTYVDVQLTNSTLEIKLECELLSDIVKEQRRKIRN